MSCATLLLVLIEGPGFELARAVIPAHLAPFVDSWIGYREVSAVPVERIEHPTGRAVLIFEFGDPIELGTPGQPTARFRTGFFAGIDEEPTLTRFVGEQAGIEVNLSSEGAFAFSRGAIAELHGQVVEAADLGITAGLVCRLAEARSWEERFCCVAESLWQRVRGARLLSPLVRHALQLIDAKHGALRIDQLSLTLGRSRKYVHERVTSESGFAPKRYAALRRFARVKELLSSGDYATLASVASRAGYSDQAHLTRDVRQFAGMTPRELALEVQKPIAFEVQRLKSAGDGSFPGRV